MNKEFDAQPARQVIDELEAFESWVIGRRETELYGIALSAWKARASLAPAAVMTDQGAEGSAAQKAFWAGFEAAYMNQSGNIRAAWNHYKDTDEFARLNRRAIPLELLEKLAHCTDPDCCIAHARGELRALLGKEGDS